VIDPYTLTFESFPRYRNLAFHESGRCGGAQPRNRRRGDRRTGAGRTEGGTLMVICPVGPIDYSHWAETMNRRQTDGFAPRDGQHGRVPGRKRASRSPLAPAQLPAVHERIALRPSYRACAVPAETSTSRSRGSRGHTRLVEQHGGADLCYGGMGLTGHFAFNDPPEPGEDLSDDQGAQLAHAHRSHQPRKPGSDVHGRHGRQLGNHPSTAITIGMYELLLSKRIHLTFMRSWHAGVLRRALFGPVTGRCPGSFVQQHPNVAVTVTEIAAAMPLVHVAQRVAA